MFLHFARSCSPLPSSNLQASKTQIVLLSYEKNMNIVIKTNLLCTSQQGYEIKFAPPNWCDVSCNECLPSGEHIYLVFGV